MIDYDNNEFKEAMDVIRKHMKDKSEGEIYHAWMCNIKFAVFDSITKEFCWTSDEENTASHGCEEGAKMFLDRLLNE